EEDQVEQVLIEVAVEARADPDQDRGELAAPAVEEPRGVLIEELGEAGLQTAILVAVVGEMVGRGGLEGRRRGVGAKHLITLETRAPPRFREVENRSGQRWLQCVKRGNTRTW